MLAPLVAAVSNPDSEKNSAYECGFEPFESARLKFDISVNSFFGYLKCNNSQLLKEYDNLLKINLNLIGNVY